MKLKELENGVGHIMAIAALAVVLVIGFAGWRVYDQNKKPASIDDILSKIDIDAKKSFSNVNFKANNDWSAERSATAFNKVEGYEYSVSGVGNNVEFIYGTQRSSGTVRQYCSRGRREKQCFANQLL